MECVECENTSEASERTNIHANMCTRMVALEEKNQLKRTSEASEQHKKNQYAVCYHSVATEW